MVNGLFTGLYMYFFPTENYLNNYISMSYHLGGLIHDIKNMIQYKGSD